jgi:hypothetical protein
MGVRWNGSEEKRQEEEGWKEEEVTLFPHLRASLVASKPGVTGDARKTTSPLQRIHFFRARPFRLASSLTAAASQGNFGP